MAASVMGPRSIGGMSSCEGASSLLVEFDAVVVWLLVMAGLPSLLTYAGVASSLTLGTIFVSVLLVAAHALRGHAVGLGSSVAAAAFVAALMLILWTCTHLGIAGAIGEVDLGRALGTLASSVIVVAAAGVLAFRLRSMSDHELDRVVRWCWLSLLVLGLLGTTQYGPTLNKYYKAVPPFTEPSLFALAYLPWALAAACRATGYRRVRVVLATAVLAFGLQSLLLVVGTLFLAAACLRWRVLLPGGVLMALSVVFLGGEYYVDRLVLSDDEPNLSTLVYLQGWQLALDAWERTSGLGLGFQQLGLSGESDAATSQLILGIIGEHVNLRDGGFVAAKLLAEFGLAGAIMVLAYAVLAFRSIRFLRRSATVDQKPQAATLVVGHAFMAAFVFEMFLRGIGYLTPSSVLLLAGALMVFGHVKRSARPVSDLSLPRQGNSAAITHSLQN
jgi:hypothetical protein